MSPPDHDPFSPDPFNTDPFSPNPFDTDPFDRDPVSRMLRVALTREADMVRPSIDGLERINQQLHGTDHMQDAEPTGPSGGSRRPGWLPWVAGLAAAAVVGVIAGVALNDPGETPVPAASPTISEPADPTPSDAPTTDPAPSEPSPSDPTPTATEAPPSGSLDQVPVYWVGSSTASLFLYREFRTVPDAGGVVASAVRAAMTQTPQDPDYSSPWRQPSRLDVTVDGDAITIDVSADALANTQVGSQLAELAVQQLVWTATAAAQSGGPVTILVDGAPADAWGAVRLGDPTTRDADARAPLWLDTPTEGAQLPAGAIMFTGQANVYEGNVQWEITDSAGTLVEEGFTTAAQGEFIPYTFKATLESGSYTVSVYSPDASDGESPEGPRMFEQDRSFTVG